MGQISEYKAELITSFRKQQFSRQCILDPCLKLPEKKHDGMIHKRNALRRAIKGLKRGAKPEPMTEPEWNFKKHEQAFGGSYRSYRANGRPRMDVDTFFSQIRGGLIKLIKRELTVLNSARIQTTTWIRFTKDDDRVEFSI